MFLFQLFGFFLFSVIWPQGTIHKWCHALGGLPKAWQIVLVGCMKAWQRGGGGPKTPKNLRDVTMGGALKQHGMDEEFIHLPKQSFRPNGAVLAKITVYSERGCLVNHWLSFSLPHSNLFCLVLFSVSLSADKDKGHVHWWGGGFAQFLTRGRECALNWYWQG